MLGERRSDVVCERTSSTDPDKMCSATVTSPNNANPDSIIPNRLPVPREPHLIGTEGFMLSPITLMGL